MADISVTLVLPNGSARRADVPDDVAVRDLLAELTSLLGLPTVGPDGRPMGYRMDSKALGRELREEETLAESGIPGEDRLMITTDITAGAGAISVNSNPRLRRLRKDYELIQEIDARSDLSRSKHIGTGRFAAGTLLITYKCKGIVGIDRSGNPKIDSTSGGDLPAQPVPAALAGHEMDDPHLAPNINMPTAACALTRPGGRPAGRWTAW